MARWGPPRAHRPGGALPNTPMLTARSGSRGSAQASLISSRCLRATSFCEKRLLLGSFELTQHEKATARAGAAGSRRLVSHRPLSCSGTGAGEGGVRPKPPAARPHGGRAVTAPLAPGAPHAVRSPASTEHQSRGDTVYVTHTKGRNKERGTERRGKFHLPTGSHAQTPKKRGKREREEGKGSAGLSRARGGAGHLGACWALAPLLPAPSCSQPRGALRLLF